MNKQPMHVAVLLITTFLAGCGGGSGGGGTPLPRAQAPVITLASIVTGLSSPLDMQQPADGTGNFFVVEQGGTIRVLQNGAILGTPFLDISGKIVSGGETGLLGLAFHPNYANNGRFYLNYTRRTTAGQLQTVIAEYTRSTGNPLLADTNSERIFLVVNQPFDNHNGGQLAFGPDGFLYIGLGDGGGAGDPQNNAQNKNVLLGKMLRIDVNTPSASKLYSIPAGNPFAAGGGAPEVFSHGFRNPWRFSFDKTGGRLFVGDVGQDAFEEIDIVTAGGNYGWNIMEGGSCFNASTCTMTGLTLPIFSYPHSDGTTVIGGYVYRGTQIPSLVGNYVYADFGNGQIWMLTESGTTWTRTPLLASGRSISAFGQAENGELFVVDYAGSILQVRP